MTLYVRADVGGVSVPPTSGGCGQPHSRPMNEGVAIYKNADGSYAPWPIDCPHCEPNLKQDLIRSGSKKVRTQNSDAGMKLADRYLGLFGGTRDTVPESPDEEKHREFLEQKTATEQAAKSAQLAETSAASMESIAKAIATLAEGQQGSSAIVQALVQALAVKQQDSFAPISPAPLPEGALPEPRLWEYPVGGVPSSPEPAKSEYRCQECLNVYPRNSSRGPAPKRCPDCKAKAAV